MSDAIEVKVPDIGDYKDVPVIEVFVKPGDEVKPEDSLIAVESDKATMEVPSPAAGTVKELRVKVGDKVSEGSLVLVLEAREAQTKPTESAAPAKAARAPQPEDAPRPPSAPAPAPKPAAAPPQSAPRRGAPA